VVLISLSDFQIIIDFGHSTFITSQLMFVPTNMVLKRHLACRKLSKCQPYSNETGLSIRTYTYKIEANNQLHNCVCGALSIKDGGVINILLQPLRWCCIDCVIHHERDVREEQKYMHVARTSNNRVISSGDLYCCLLPW